MSERKPYILRGYEISRRAFDRQYVALLMEKSENNLARARRISGLSRSTIWRLLKRCGLKLTIKLEDAPR